jgi:holo-[acyl-carrier protein] synthase
MRLGIDMQPIDEVADSLRTYGARYTSRLFTESELNDSRADSSLFATRLAGCVAAKEAVFKLLCVHEDVPAWNEIEVRRNDAGNDDIVLHGTAATLRDRLGLGTLLLSLSYGAGVATAVVVADRDTNLRS